MENLEFYQFGRTPILLSIILFILILGGCGIEKGFIYYPEKRIIETPADAGLEFEELYLQSADNIRINAWFIPSPGSKQALLWLHGNGGNISHRVGHLRLLHRTLKMNIFMIDYREYGRSEGNVTEKGTYQDALAAYDYLSTRKEIGPAEIIVYGQSLGAAIAAEVAVQRKVAGVILESPFSSIREMARVVFPWLPVGRFLSIRYDVRSKVAKVEAPLLIIHGDQDEVVPYSQGRQVFDAAAPPKTFYTIPGAGHNDLYYVGGEDYYNTLSQFIEGLPTL